MTHLVVGVDQRLRCIRGQMRPARIGCARFGSIPAPPSSDHDQAISAPSELASELSINRKGGAIFGLEDRPSGDMSVETPACAPFLAGFGTNIYRHVNSLCKILH